MIYFYNLKKNKIFKFQNFGLYGTFTLINGILGGSIFFFHCTGNETVNIQDTEQRWGIHGYRSIGVGIQEYRSRDTGREE